MPKIGNRWDVAEHEDERQKRASLKRRIYEEDFLGDITALIKSRMADPAAQKGVAAFAAETVNFTASLTHAVAVVYDYGVRRYLRGAPTALSEAFADLVREADAPLLQAQWNVWAWLLGPTFAVPSVRDGAMKLTLVTPDVSWVAFRAGEVDAILWRHTPKLYVEVTADGWRYFDEKGRPAQLDEFGTDRDGFVPLELTRAPIATFRCDLPGKDWWSSTRHRGLAMGTLEAAFWWAHLQWVRKSQSRYLISAKCPKDKLIAGQNAADPEIPYLFDGEPDEAEFEVTSMVVSVDDHLKQIRFIGEQIAEREGVPGAEVTFDNSNEDWGNVSLGLRREKLAHVHRQQVPFLVKGERELWPAVVAVARAAGHRHAGILPPPDEVRDMLAVEFSELEVVADPAARLALDAEELKLGLTSPAKIMQRRHPDMTLEQCERLQRENLSQYAGLLEFIASRNIPTTPGRATETLAEAQGRAGGTISGQVRREQQETT